MCESHLFHQLSPPPPPPTPPPPAPETRLYLLPHLPGVSVLCCWQNYLVFTVVTAPGLGGCWTFPVGTP